MMQPKLICDPASLKAQAGGSATGIILFKINDRYFPSNGWNDFVVVVMGWWAGALLRLVRGVSTHERIPFMDGPYAIDLRMDSSKVLRFRALQGGNRNTEVASGAMAMDGFIDDMILQGREVLVACERLNWWSKDAEVLKAALEALAKNDLS